MPVDNKKDSVNEERRAWRTMYERIGVKVAGVSSMEEERQLIGGQRHTYPIPKRSFYFETVPQHLRMTLDLGCGMGDIIGWLHRNAKKVVAVDFSWTVLRAAREKLARNSDQEIFFVVGDAVNLPFADASFDRFTCMNVLSLLNLEDVCAAIKESYRVSKDNASILFTIRNSLSPYALVRDVAIKLISLTCKKKVVYTHYYSHCWCRKQFVALGGEILTEHSHGMEPFPAPPFLVSLIRSIEVVIARVMKILRPFGVNYIFEVRKVNV